MDIHALVAGRYQGGLVVFSSAVPVLDGPTISGLDFDGSVCKWSTVSESLETNT